MDKSRLRAYWLATRPYSFTATLVPILIGTAVAKVLFPALTVQWGHFLLALFGAISIHIVSNVLNDVFDAKSGLDNKDNFGRFNSIVAGAVTPKEMFGIAAVFSVVSLLIGIYFLTVVGTPLLVLLVLGAFLAFFYTMPPVRLKHHALGDLAVLLGFGLGMAYGAYMVQAHAMPGYLDSGRLLTVLAYALPTALPMVGILQANNHRDRINDREYGAKTLSNVLSPRLSKDLLIAVLVVPFALLLATSIPALTTAWVLLVVLSIPPLLKILREIKADHFEGPLVPQIAQFHGMFGLLATVGMVVKSLVG
ncbi:prenyltransferase [bacterium]|nr:MAG: prenyltransferase [bacterium]